MNSLNLFKTKTAFTLAEVLVTLVVIGIVAALVIPSLAQNISNVQQKAAWKDVYSTINQATRRLINDNGGTVKGVCSD